MFSLARAEARKSGTLQLPIDMRSFEIATYTIRASSKGAATTTPLAIPLPAAGWLLIAGPGELALAARCRVA